MWKHALLEVYAPCGADEWPDGTPADWIEQGIVGYSNGLPRGYVLLAIPLWQLIWWTVLDMPARVELWFWRRRRSDD